MHIGGEERSLLHGDLLGIIIQGLLPLLAPQNDGAERAVRGGHGSSSWESNNEENPERKDASAAKRCPLQEQ